MLKNRSTIYCLVLFLSFTLTIPPTNAQAKVMIYGKVSNTKIEKMQLKGVSDNFMFDELIAESAIRKDSSFEIEFELSEPGIFKLNNVSIWISPEAVSYTHLTLPTILLV